MKSHDDVATTISMSPYPYTYICTLEGGGDEAITVMSM